MLVPVDEDPERRVPRARGRRAPRAPAAVQEGRAPGVVALVDGEAAGWCSVAPRIQHHRLMRSRSIPMLDEDAWSIVCFVVRAPFRRRGVADHLLAGAVAFAEAEGARVVEGYPIDAASGRVSSAFAYVGSTTLFERAGFERAAETTSRSGGAPRWVMRRELAG
ncbi:GNAT family N-acetyltransferase [Agrococcus sp. SGAir0287]|uniref:GNAT family N-acetyltransferase n=1 Tax=Agrococcus sp. SGAir0287 TaxID=2070347 RepID=UPI0015865089|nr:GNAT family N-acetyltransferase [Agrococcus sp. SGAir0287]